MFTALWINWRVPANSWLLSEGVETLGRAGGGSWKKIGAGGISGQKRVQVFEVEGSVCGGDEG